MNVHPAEEKRMLWSLFIFRRLPTRESASVRDEQAGDFIMLAHTWTYVIATPTAGEKNREVIWENKFSWMEREGRN